MTNDTLRAHVAKIDIIAKRLPAHTYAKRSPDNLIGGEASWTWTTATGAWRLVATPSRSGSGLHLKLRCEGRDVHIDLSDADLDAMLVVMRALGAIEEPSGPRGGEVHGEVVTNKPAPDGPIRGLLFTCVGCGARRQAPTSKPWLCDHCGSTATPSPLAGR